MHWIAGAEQSLPHTRLTKAQLEDLFRDYHNTRDAVLIAYYRWCIPRAITQKAIGRMLGCSSGAVAHAQRALLQWLRTPPGSEAWARYSATGTVGTRMHVMIEGS